MVILIPDVPVEQPLHVMRGDDFVKDMDFTFTVGDLVGCFLWMTVKRNSNDPDALALVQITSDPGAGIVMLTPTSARFSIASRVMARMPVKTSRYDVQCRYPSGQIRTAARGSFDVTADDTLSR